VDLITSLSRLSRQNDSIMVVADKLTKVVHFIPLISTYSASDIHNYSSET